MEQFLIAALGSLAVLLALILGSHYRARPAVADRPRCAIGATVAIAALGGILVVATVAYAGLAILQRRGYDAQRAALAAQNDVLAAKLKDAMAHQHRAWVYATPSLNGPMIIKGRGISLAARYKIENSGDAPAADVHIVSAVIPHVEVDIEALQKSLCERLRADNNTPTSTRDSLLPGQSIDLTRSEGADADLAEGQIAQGAASLKFWWVGCVGYKSSGNPALHRSGFIYEIAETGAGPHGIVTIGLTDQIIPKNRLVIIPYPGGGFPAD